MTGPEQKFYARLRIQLVRANAFIQRLEVTTGRGVPDLFIVMPTLCSSPGAGWATGFFIELKACPSTNLQIRSEQYAWLRKANMHGVMRSLIFLIINEDPNSREITVVPEYYLKDDCVSITQLRHVRLNKGIEMADGMPLLMAMLGDPDSFFTTPE